MEQITSIGIDLAKNVFQIHTVDDAGTIVILKPTKPPGAVG